MSGIQIHINKLANEIGPRGSTSKEEKQAAEYIADYLSKLNKIEVLTQPFSSPWTWSWPNSITLLLALIGVVLYVIYPIVGLVCVGGAMFFFLSENDNRPFLSRLMPKQPSQNVIGKLPPANKKTKTVVLIAHMDSSRADYAHHPDRVNGFRKLVLLNFGLFWIILFMMFFGIFLDISGSTFIINNIEWFFSLILVIPVMFSFFLAVTRQSRYNIVHGANDNASGVSLVLDVMKEFVEDPLPTTELVCVLTGCEEVNCNGMVAFLDEYGGDLKTEFFLNYDNIGSGTPIFASKEGMFYAHHADPELLDLARSVKNDLQNSKVEERPFRAGYTDGTAGMVKGYKVLSFLALNDFNVPPDWHWVTDTIENINEDVIYEIKEFSLNLLKKRDKFPDSA